MNRSAFVALTALACFAVAPRRAEADALALVAAAPIARVTPAGQGVAVLGDGVVRLLDAEGRAGARCPRYGRRAGARRPDGTSRQAAEVLRDSGFSDEDESPEAEELLDDEGVPTRARRRRAPGDGPPRALDLVGTAQSVWIGAEDGLWRLDLATSRCARVGLDGRPVERVAAGAGAVVAISGATVWRAAGPSGFDVAAVLPSRARAAALGGDGTIFVADGEGVARIGAARVAGRALDGRVEALAACGPVVYALAGDGLYLLNGADVDRLGPPPPARALACASPGLIAAGVGLWTSAEGGAWAEDAAGLGRAFTDVAASAGRVWLVTGEGLFVPVPGAEIDDALLFDGPPPRARRSFGSPPLWAALRPHLSVVVDDWTESAGRTGWRLWVALTISLDRHALSRRPLAEGDR
jgi:hypothetical protein